MCRLSFKSNENECFPKFFLGETKTFKTVSSLILSEETRSPSVLKEAIG